MKKSLNPFIPLVITFIVILMGFAARSCQAQSKSDSTKTQPRDSITLNDIQKHRYLSTVDMIEYNQQCYKDSISVYEFYGKDPGGEFWKNKGRFYWDPFETLPQGVKFLHWRPTWAGYVEFFSGKYRNVPVK